jgi:hypothetical protein
VLVLDIIKKTYLKFAAKLVPVIPDTGELAALKERVIIYLAFLC